MAKIKFTNAAIDYLQRREIADKILILITDDAGGKYSINGGSCSMGMHYSIIWVNSKDPDYPEKLENEQNIKIFSSDYDLTMLGNDLVLDYKNAALMLKNDSGLLDGGVEIGNGEKLLEANYHVHQGEVRNC